MIEPKRSGKKRASEKPAVERRAAPRLSPSAIPSLKSVRLVAGPEVRLINISRSGALVESEARLSPGSNLCIRLVTEESMYLLKGRVVRARAAAFAGTTIRYQIAVAFDEELPILAGAEAEELSSKIAESEKPPPDESRTAPSDSEADPDACESSPVVTVIANYADMDKDLQRMFEINNW